MDACQSCCKSTSVDEVLHRINSPLLLGAKYCWFTYAISSTEGANFSLTIVVMVQKSNAIRANCLSTPAQFNYSCAADNYCLAVWDARLMNDIRTCFHLALLHACTSFHRHSRQNNTRSLLSNTWRNLCTSAKTFQRLIMTMRFTYSFMFLRWLCNLPSWMCNICTYIVNENRRFNLMLHPEGFCGVLHCKKEIKAFVKYIFLLPPKL